MTQSATPSRIEALVERAFERRDPFSLIRLGDGESGIMGFPEFSHKNRYMRWLQSFFGSHVSSLEPYERLKLLLKDSIVHADVVGASTTFDGDWEGIRQELITLGEKPNPSIDEKRTLTSLERRALGYFLLQLIKPNTPVTTGDIHIRLEESGLLQKLISSSRVVNIVTCNDLAAVLSEKYPNILFRQHSIPGEFKFEASDSKENWISKAPHFPDVFDHILSQIGRGEFDGLTLVGAGPCGKVYCNAVKQAGGFALDIGSIMDLWANRSTRSYMTGVKPKTLNR